MVERDWIERSSKDYKSYVLPLNYRSMEASERIELSYNCFADNSLTTWVRCHNVGHSTEFHCGYHKVERLTRLVRLCFNGNQRRRYANINIPSFLFLVNGFIPNTGNHFHSIPAQYFHQIHSKATYFYGK